MSLYLPVESVVTVSVTGDPRRGVYVIATVDPAAAGVRLPESA